MADEKKVPHEKRGGINMAIFLAQQEIPVIKKDSVNPHFKSKYADLPSIWEGIKETMKKNELVIVHTTQSDEDGDHLHTRITHVPSGEFIESSCRILLSRATAQEFGSFMTYMRRYALCAMLGIVTDDDDDGEEASKKPEVKKTTPPKTTAAVSDKEFSLMNKVLRTAETMPELLDGWKKIYADFPSMTEDQRRTITLLKDKKKFDLETDDIPY